MNYCFSEKEFSAVLAICGISRIYSFELGEPLSNRQEAARILQTFYINEITEMDNGELTIREPLCTMIRKMAEAEQVLRIDMPDSQVPPQIVYPYERNKVIVLLHIRSGSAPSFRLLSSSPSEFFSDMVYEELLELFPPIRSFSECAPDEKERIAEETSMEEASVCLRASRFCSRSGERIGELTILRKGMYYGIELEGEEEDSLPFAEEYFRNYLCRNSGGNDR